MSRIRIPSGSNGGGRFGADAGFTLLEVMIAVAVIALALVTLIGAQSQSVSIGGRSQFDLLASLLAQGKIAEYHLRPLEELRDEEGDFGEEHPDFAWKTEVRDLSGEALGFKGPGGQLKTLDLTVASRRDLVLTYTVRTFLGKNAGPGTNNDPGKETGPVKTNVRGGAADAVRR